MSRTHPSLSLWALGLVMASLGTTAAANAPTPAANHLAQIQTTGQVRVCIWPDYYSISLRDPRTQQLSGIDIDLAHELGRDLGASVQFIDSSFARLVPDVLQERCDVAMFAIGIIPQRQQVLRFTRPYLASDVMAITTRSNRKIRTWADIDQPGIVVAVAKGTLHEPLMRERLKNAELIAPATPHAREQEVQSGRADVFITDFPYSRRMLETTDWARLVTPSSTYHITSYAWAVKPGDDAWHARLEQFMQTIKRDGRLLAAARKHKLDPIVVTD
ncbi:ABC transporter substrate-binding protein [Simplicispira psychrophila]|uniref:ABC transporter substrate-binding protein n=1 Tax=Simplicispira psychrophila TaxID=80882 RepID=UPI0004813C27|nr:ABC transporter substrate-binding protein [Simplicispira psychrophila]